MNEELKATGQLSPAEKYNRAGIRVAAPTRPSRRSTRRPLRLESAGDGRRVWSIAMALLATVLTMSCSVGQSIESARAAVGEFHAMYNKGSYAAIYSTADDAFRRKSSDTRFVELMSAIHHKLGVEKESHMSTWSIVRGAGGTHVVLSYSTRFEGGEAREDFIWHISGEHSWLVGYNITSAVLVLK